jgi:transposase
MALVEMSSGDVHRRRLSRAGDRQLNYAMHITAVTQIRYNAPGQSSCRRKRAADKSHNRALRCLTQRPADVVYRALSDDGYLSVPEPLADGRR